MDPSMPDSPRTTTSTRLFVVGAVILLALNAFLSSLRAKPTGRDTSYLIGTVVGAGLVFTIIGLVVYGIARAFRNAKTAAGAARLAFWTMAALFVVTCATLVGQVPSVSPTSADTIVTDAERQGLTIQVVKMARVDEGAFRRFTHGIREGFTRSKVVDETLSWKPGASEYRLTMLHPMGFYATTRCIPRVETGRSLIVCVSTTANQPDALESSRTGLKLIQ